MSEPAARTPAECAYAAGMVDGNGTIAIFNYRAKGPLGVWRDRYKLDVLVYNSNEPALTWLCARFGGRVNRVHRQLDDDPCHKLGYAWATGWQAGARMLRQVRPYLLIKATLADLYLEFASTSKRWGSPGVPLAVEERRAAISAQMKLLNTKGKGIALDA